MIEYLFTMVDNYEGKWEFLYNHYADRIIYRRQGGLSKFYIRTEAVLNLYKTKTIIHTIDGVESRLASKIAKDNL